MNLRFLTSFFLRHLFLLLFIGSVLFSRAQTSLNSANIDPEILNKFVQKELNKYREKAKVEKVQTDFALSFAADDHSAYMLRKEKLTHKQRLKEKKTPKNRVDFYGAQFDIVGENVQLNNLNLHSTVDDKKQPLINTYEKLAEELVNAWKDSPPHYANMVNPNFKTTYTSVTIGENGKVYACQLFGGAKYKDEYAEFRDTVQFKPYRASRCWRCRVRPPKGMVSVLEDSTIVFTYTPPRMLFGLLPKPSFSVSRMRFFNPWRDGLAADIVVKSQYPCDTNSYFNGLSNVRGVLLEPVYKKDYMGIPLNQTRIVLGKVPSFIDEEFEVNLVVIQNKRPCMNIMFNVFPSELEVEIPLDFAFEPSNAVVKEYKIDTISKRLYFDKNKVTPIDSSHTRIIELIDQERKTLQKIEITGFASIEGSTQNNTLLYKNRADYLLQELVAIRIDSSLVNVTATENFKDFRSDIIGTKYENLGLLSDSTLKEKLSNKELSTELEFLLENHRYVDIELITRYDVERTYDAKIVNKNLKQSIKRGNTNESVELQRVQYRLLLEGNMTIEEIESVDIPYEKRNLKLLHNLALMKFKAETMTRHSLKKFRSNLSDLLILKENDRDLNTSMAIIDYYLYNLGYYENKKVAFYDSIRKWSGIDKVQQARILLNIATTNDWSYWNKTGSRKESKYYFNKVKRYIRYAKLDVDKTFEIASYYSFFWKYKYALDLTKRKIDETMNPNDLIFFLKLIHLTGVNLPRNRYLKYFKKIRRYSGDEFCTFFNNPALNFQIFDDEEIKEIYCKECSNK